MEDRDILSHLIRNHNKGHEIFFSLAGDLTCLEKKKRNIVSRAQKEHILNTSDTNRLLVT